MPTASELKTLYEIGLKELLKSDVVISLETPKGYTLNDLIKQIKQDYQESKTGFKKAMRCLQRESIILTHHQSRKRLTNES